MNKLDATYEIAELVQQAKDLLKSAKEIADENNVYFCIQDLYEEVTGEYPDWYSSAC